VISTAARSIAGWNTSWPRTARVPVALDAIARGDREAIGSLAQASQKDAERLLQNQIAETSSLAALALESGAFASSSFGAGFGGSVWALAPASEGEKILRVWRRRYVERHPAVENVTGFLARPAPASADDYLMTICPVSVPCDGLSWSWKPHVRAVTRLPVSRLCPATEIRPDSDPDIDRAPDAGRTSCCATACRY
jgi:hypothetical protein